MRGLDLVSAAVVERVRDGQERGSKERRALAQLLTTRCPCAESPLPSVNGTLSDGDGGGTGAESGRAASPPVRPADDGELAAGALAMVAGSEPASSSVLGCRSRRPRLCRPVCDMPSGSPLPARPDRHPPLRTYIRIADARVAESREAELS